MKKFCLSLLIFLASQLFIFGQSQKGNPASRYKTDYSAIKEVGRDLLDQLKPTFRDQLSPNPIWVIDELRPYTRPYQFIEGTVPTRIVYVTTGFIELLNTLAHAKAIDKIENGFFDRYLASLSETGQQVVPTLPQISDPRYWTDDVMNEQGSYFNQIIGAVTAIDLAHHYLAHYERYGDLLEDSAISPVTMAMSCTRQEWDLAFKLGAANALECGFGVEGLKALYDSIERMPKRPGWTLYFLPRNADVSKLKKELDKIENRFFGVF